MSEDSGAEAALARLAQAHRAGLLADAEYLVAQEAMRGATEDVDAGRALRLEAAQALAPVAGSPIIIMDVLRKARLCKYDWTHLALHLDGDQLRARLLGLSYSAAPEKWELLLDRLEHLARAGGEEALSPEELEAVKYTVLGRSHWLELVGELVWLQSGPAGLDLWRREDGWYVSDRHVDTMIDSIMEKTPYEKSPVRDQRIHHYFDWVQDQCWRRFNDVIAGGDTRAIRYQGLQRLDDGVWTFGA